MKTGDRVYVYRLNEKHQSEKLKGEIHNVRGEVAHVFVREVNGLSIGGFYHVRQLKKISIRKDKSGAV